MEVIKLQNALIVFCLVVYYITYKLCRAANVSDCQELEDKLFLETYVYKKEQLGIGKESNTNENICV